MRLHGSLTDEAARAIVLKAGEAWGGAAELSGAWSASDQDSLWLAAQRTGIRLDGCSPSDAARQTWADERAALAERQTAIGGVADANRLATTVLKAASGDVAALRKLESMDRGLAEFVTGYLDDDDRAQLTTMEAVDVIPELARFRQLGEEELARQGNQATPLSAPVSDRDEPDEGAAPTMTPVA